MPGRGRPEAGRCIMLERILYCFFVSLSIFLVCWHSHAGDCRYPQKVEIIERSQTTYDTPENTLAAVHSAVLKRNMDWAFECLTKESAERMKSLLKEAGKSPEEAFEPINPANMEGFRGCRRA